MPDLAPFQPSIDDFADGEPAFLALAAAHHERCLQDPALNHSVSHPGKPDHIHRLTPTADANRILDLMPGWRQANMRPTSNPYWKWASKPWALADCGQDGGELWIRKSEVRILPPQPAFRRFGTQPATPDCGYVMPCGVSSLSPSSTLAATGLVPAMESWLTTADAAAASNTRVIMSSPLPMRLKIP
jgi:hypothetical protein